MKQFSLLALLSCVCLAFSAPQTDTIETGRAEDAEEASEYTSTTMFVDEDKGVTGLYEAETKSCYLVEDVPISAESEVQSELDSPTEQLAYRVTNDREVEDRSLLPVDLQKTCARLPLYRMEFISPDLALSESEDSEEAPAGQGAKATTKKEKKHPIARAVTKCVLKKLVKLIGIPTRRCKVVKLVKAVKEKKAQNKSQ